MIENYSENAKSIYKNLYLARNNEDKIVENIKQCHERVAHFLAINEKEQEEFYTILQEKRFRPNTPTMINAGINPDQSLLACHILGLEDSMESIIEMWATCAKIYADGGGVGIPMTNLRPAGANISTGGQASGPLSYAKVIQAISDQVRSGGRARRAASLLSFWYKHKDIFDLVRMKEGNDDFSAINISVLIDSLFMKTRRNGDHKDLWAEIVTQAWKTGDPGLIFFDTANEVNPFPSLGKILTGNPCMEILLPSYNSCNLGHLNVNHYFKAGQFMLSEFERDIEIAVRFLNRVIDKTSYPNLKFKENMQIARPIGLGLMGFADVLYKLRIPYGSEESIGLFSNLTKQLTKHAFESSIFLAENENISVKCPKEDEKHFLELQERFGVEKSSLNIANSTVTCLAPTGSTAISADCCYSFEPIFSLIWSKKLTDRDETLYFVNEEFENYCKNRSIQFTDDLKKKITENNGSIKGLREFDKTAEGTFVTAHDIHWRDRLKMQAAGQRNISMSISSTINLPNSATVKEVEEVCYNAWKMGLKGITVYRDGSKENQPVNFGSKTKKDEIDIEIIEKMVKELMDEGSSSWASNVYEKEQYLADLIIGMIGKYCPSATLEETESAPIRERPQELFGKTVKMKTGSGELYLTINELDGVPFEVFATIGKGGRSISAKAEAVGRLVSLCLRAGVRVSEIVKQLDGIGGDYPIFQEGRLIKSIPDAIATVLRGYENKKKEELTVDTGEKWDDKKGNPVKDIMKMKEDIKNQTGLENIPTKNILEETMKNSWTPETDLFESIKKSKEEHKKALQLCTEHPLVKTLKNERAWPDREDEAVLPDSGSICPECGQPSFSYSSGCRGGQCMNPDCGFSNCS